MKIFCLAAALFFLMLPAFSQSLTVRYDIINKNVGTLDTGVKGVLTIDGTLSRFLVQLPAKYVRGIQPKEGLVKDKRSSLCYFEDHFFNTRFSIKDTLHNMRWRLTSQSQTILGYPCLSATTTFRGRTYIAYYTLKLPISNGPWKLGGLPGLILAAKADDGYMEWRATDVTLSQVPPIDLTAVKTRENIDWNTFVAKYKESVQRRAKYVRSQGTLPDDAEAKMSISSLEIFYPELQTGEGITY